jgi:hypothetical protein
MCGTHKERDAFGKDRSRTDGLNPRCRDCARPISRENAIKWNRLHPERMVNNHLKRAYGLNLAEYEAMLATQGGVCAICGKPERSHTKSQGISNRLSVDHDHATGAIRGLLCRACNFGIAAFDEDREKMASAIAYLSAHSEVPPSPTK